MHVKSYLLPALAVFSSVVAQDDDDDCSGTKTIRNAAEASALSGCRTIEGDVVIGRSPGSIIRLDGPERITGDLKAENASGLTTLASSTIEEIEGEMLLTELTVLGNLQFDELTKVGSLSFTALPALSSLNFGKTISEADEVLISNTFLENLDGIDLDTVSKLNINNNPRMQEFSTKLESIKVALNLEANSRNLKVDFPNLKWAANMTLRNISSINIPSLAAINGSLGFYETFLEEVAAPNLTVVGRTAGSGSKDGGLAIVSNAQLTNISFPLLKESGGVVQVANNTRLSDIAFPSLEDIGGALDFAGNFTDPELPKLDNIDGAMNVQSTNEIDCDSLQELKDDDKVQGKFTCESDTDDAKSLDDDDEGGSSSGSDDDSAAAQYTISAAIAGLSVIAVFAQML